MIHARGPLPVLALALACCGDPDLPLRAEFRIDPPNPGLCTEFTVTVIVRSDRPVVILGTEFDPWHKGPGREAAFGASERDSVRLEAASVLIRDTPTVRHWPNPRVDWTGDDEIAHFPVLLPGRELSFSRRLRADAEQIVTSVSVDFAALSPGRGLLVLDPDSVLVSGPPDEGPPDAEERIVGRASFGYVRAGPFPAAPERSFPIGSTPVVSVYPCALRVKTAAGLKRKWHFWHYRVQVTPPGLPLDEARRRAGVATGAAAWWPEKGAWVLADGDSSLVVTTAGVTTRAGCLAPLVDDLGCTGSATVRLLPALAERVAAFAARGFATGRCNYDEGLMATVEVTSERLDEFLAIVEDCGLLDCYTIRPRP